MAGKFIPDSDHDFARMARVFAEAVAAEPGRYFLDEQDALLIGQVVKAFRERLALAIGRMTRTTQAICEKDAARLEAERVLRRYGAIIRANPQVDRAAKFVVGVRERPVRLHRRACPDRPPHLRFLGGDGRVHVLEFREAWGAKSRAKPRGASRLELFVELVEPGEPLPVQPGARPWYVRSFSSSPMRVEFPRPQSPKMVVYWGRWADAKGEVGPWSKRVDARVEWGGAVSTAGAGTAMGAAGSNERGMRLAG